MTKTQLVNALRQYVEKNEVVWQFCGDLVEMTNDNEKENGDALLGYFRTAKRIEGFLKRQTLVA